MRKVKVFHILQSRKVEKGIAKFHQFGCDHDEFESGPGNFSTAIVEWDDGTIENVYVGMIQFID